MKSIKEHEDCANGDYSSQNQLIFPLLNVDALYEGIDSWESVGEIVEAILKPLEGTTLPLQRLLRLDRYAYLVVYQIMRVGYMLAFLDVHVTSAQVGSSIRIVHQTGSPEKLFSLDLNCVILCDFVKLSSIRMENVSMAIQCVHHCSS